MYSFRYAFRRRAAHPAAALAWLLLSAPLSDRVAAGESIGDLRPGMTIVDLEQRLGAPASREEQPPECPGDRPLVVWNYAAKGLMLVSDGSAPSARLVSISTSAPSPFATATGIGIGATYDRVLSAYPGAADPSRASFRVEVDNAALEIGFSGEDPPRVERLMLSAEPPGVYEEGKDCGHPDE